MINNKKVGEAITALRKKQKLTQKNLADKLNVSDKAISKWERGLGLPDISILSTLSMILDTDMESLLEGNAEYKKDNWIGAINLNYSDVNISTLIYDKPLIVYQIGYLMLAGIKNIYIIGKNIEKKLIARVTKNVNVTIKYINDINDLPKENTMLINKPLFIYGQNITRSFQKSMERKDGITILSLPEHISNNININYDSNHKVVNMKDSIETSYRYNGLPILFYPKGYGNNLLGKDLLSLVQKYRDEAILYTEPMFRGIIYISLDDKQSISDASKIVEIVQKRDYLVSDLEEINSRRGYK